MSIRFCSINTGGVWLKIGDERLDAELSQEGSKEITQSFLLECLTSTNLVVLMGLGTSLYLNAARSTLPNKEPVKTNLAPTMRDLWTSVRDETGSKFDEVLNLVTYAPDDGQENIELLLSRCKMTLDLWPVDHAKRLGLGSFVRDAESVIRRRCSFASRTTDLYAHEILLQRIGKRSARKPRTKIFTTNYDLCLEEAARRLQFVVVDGFSHSTPQTFDPGYFAHDVVRRERSGEAPDYIENVFHLHKLHGSVDWSREGGEVVRKENAESPLLIYPRSSKYEQAFEPPFLDMMGFFQGVLRQPDTALIVIGFGFNDEHLSQPIMAALRANLSLRLLVWDPGFFDDGFDTGEQAIEIKELRNGYHERTRWLIGAGDPRIALLRGSFEDFVREVPDMVAESDRERHAQRMHELWLKESLFQ